jgi:hypothetical protein
MLYFIKVYTAVIITKNTKIKTASYKDWKAQATPTNTILLQQTEAR